jgi:hypothetical protein
MLATVYAESGGDVTESAAIADVIMNRADYTGNSIMEVIQDPINKIVGYGSKDYKKVMNGEVDINGKAIGNVREGVINAILDGNDYSNGAYFWEGISHIVKPDNFFNKRLIIDPPIFQMIGTIGSTTFMRYNPGHPTYGRRVFP